MQYKNISSLALLKKTSELIRTLGYTAVNIDSIIVAQRPKLSPYIDTMRYNIAQALSLSPDSVSVKATTEEGLGFTGNLQGISSYAVCLIEK